MRSVWIFLIDDEERKTEIAVTDYHVFYVMNICVHSVGRESGFERPINTVRATGGTARS